MVVSSQVGSRDVPALLPHDNPVALKLNHNAVSSALRLCMLANTV